MIKIVVIDDNSDILDEIMEILEINGFSVQGTGDGYQGVDLVRQFEPDLVICDVAMPAFDGYQVLTELQKFPQTATIPFIFMTAKTDREARRYGMELGADDFITKPFKTAELLASINTRIVKHRSTEEIHQTTIRMLKKNITYALPHELKTPLGIVLGYTKLILDTNGEIGHDTLMSWISEIDKGGKRLERVIENYLVYTQLELLNEPEQIQQLKNNIVPNVVPIISSTAVEIAQNCNREDDLELDVEAIALRMSSADLRKIVYEITDNAFKFSAKGTPVSVKAKRDKGDYVIYIYDQGRGIRPEHLEIMGGYMQFDRTLYEQQGLGLGFAIAKKLIQFHDGQLSINTEVNTGTLIKIRFPLY